MRVSLNWLKEYVDINIAPDELAEKLDLSGTAVEAVHYLSGLEKVVVAEIRKIDPHPHADRLSYCQVAKDHEVLNIVCGATNIEVGDKVPLALPGAILPSGLEIRESRIRGLASEGMICSEAELGVGEDAQGIMILPKNAPTGASLSQFLGIEDWVLELEITPNRPDCLGMIGVAREVAALLERPLRLPKIEFSEENLEAKSLVNVEIKDADLCPRYAARLLEGLKIAASPFWLKRRLEAAGFRPINNVVDVTNYVMLETGQPLHAFDFKLLKEGKIIVCRAQKGEYLETIDHLVRKLTPEMLVIADASRPVALAGIMGGAQTEIAPNTQEVLIESANFLAPNIMRTSRQLGLISESSYRFEKGVDIGGTVFALNRAAQLMAEVSGGKILKGEIDNFPKPKKPLVISLRPARVNQVLGTTFTPKEISAFLERLELKTSPFKKELKVTIPTFRVDLEREIDLIEEIARLYGLNRIPATLPLSTEKERGLSLIQKTQRKLREALITAGLNEIVTYSFIARADLERLLLPAEHLWQQVVELSNPLSEEQAILRPTLLPGLLNAVVHNYNRGQKNIHLFEMGNVFLQNPQEKLPQEVLTLAGVLSGNWQESQWYEPAKAVDFFDLKGILTFAAREIKLSDFHLRGGFHPCLHPGCAAEILSEEDLVGFAGQLHFKIQETYGIDQPVFVFHLSVPKLLHHVGAVGKLEEIPRHPPIVLDLALVMDEKFPAARVEALIRETGGKLLKEVRLFDLYRGESIPSGKKSLAFSLTYQAEDRTLTDEEVERIHQRIINRAAKELGAELRS